MASDRYTGRGPSSLRQIRVLAVVVDTHRGVEGEGGSRR